LLGKLIASSHAHLASPWPAHGRTLLKKHSTDCEDRRSAAPGPWKILAQPHLKLFKAVMLGNENEWTKDDMTKE
jgi:hypothetical protein